MGNNDALAPSPDGSWVAAQLSRSFNPPHRHSGLRRNDGEEGLDFKINVWMPGREGLDPALRPNRRHFDLHPKPRIRQPRHLERRARRQLGLLLRTEELRIP